MENFVLKLIKTKFLFFITALVLLSPFAFFVFAYSPHYTHPDLTEEIAKLWNLKTNNQELKISQKEINWMRNGAINEDEPPRWINHFYDPIYKVGWQGKHFGTLNQAEGLYQGESIAPKPVIASIDWATNQEYQAAYGRQYGNQTWQKAIKSYIDGDKKSAFIALGHILHLIEDVSVPDHTRNDTHADLFGDPGSPYENYAKEQTNFNKLNIAENLKNKTLPSFSTIQSAFEYLANYSNNNFFSEDTISNEEYIKPDLKNLQKKVETLGKDKFIFLYNNNNIQTYLAFFDKNKDKYTLNNKSLVLPSYFSNLSSQAVLTGASVLKLFFQEVEKAKQNPELIPEITPDSKEETLSYLKKSPRLAAVNAADVGDKIATDFKIYAKAAADTAGFVYQKTADTYLQVKNQIFSAVYIGQSNLGMIASNNFQIQPTENFVSPQPISPLVFVSSPPEQIKPVDRATVQTVEAIPSPEPIKDSWTQTVTEQSIPAVSAELGKVGVEESSLEEAAVEEKADAKLAVPANAAPSPTEPTAPVSNPITAPTYSYVSYSSPAPPEPVSPPPAPTITLNNGLDFATSTALLTLTGGKSEKAEAALVNNSSEGVVYPLTTTWSKEITLAKGLNTFSVKAKNSAGESPEVAINITLDSIPPAVPQITSHAANQILNTSTILLTGTAEASSTILITQNNAELGSVSVDGNGAWQKNVTLAAGANNFQVIAKDAVGNQSSTLNFILYFSNYQLRSIVINEIAWAGTRASDDDEWIELYNPGTSTIDLTGWQLISSDNTPTITLSGTIGAYGFYLLERTDDTAVSDIAANQSYTGALSNDGEYLKLLDPNGVPIDEVNASAGWFAGQNQKIGDEWQRISMERINPNQSGNESSNWGSNNLEKINGEDAEGNDILGTPKKANSLYVPVLPTAVSDLAISSNTNNSVTLSWSAPSDADALNSQLGYDIRYSNEDLSKDSEWKKASKAEGEPAVSEAGQTQTFTVSGLEANKTYYFALKTADPDGNYSAISNIVNFTTPPALIYEQNFDALNDAPLCNQDGWAGWCHWTISTPYEDEGPAYNGSKAVRNNSGGTHVSKTFASTQKALIFIAVKLHHSPTVQMNLKSGDTLLGYVSFNVYGGLQLVGKNSKKAADFSEDVWHLAQIETDSDKKRFRAKLGDDSWSDWMKFFDNAEGDLNKIEIYYWKPNLFTDYGYFDAVSISQAP